MSLRFSIITVTFDAAKVLQYTADSLWAQQGADVEFIVMDGGSRDGTQDMVKAWGDRVDVFVSEKDGGIFDAMNKAVARASGDVVYFLNADDAFVDGQVLADVARAFEDDPSLDLVYGNVIARAGQTDRRAIYDWITPRTIFYGDLCHQCVFARRSLFLRHGLFDTRLNTDGDYEWLLRVFHAGARSKYVDRDIAFFAAGGFHTQNAQAHAVQRLGIQRRYRSAWRLKWGTLMLRVHLKLRKWMGAPISPLHIEDTSDKGRSA